MKELMEDTKKQYMTLEKYIEYVNSQCIGDNKIEFELTLRRLTKGLNDEEFKENIVMSNQIIYIKKIYIYDSINLYKNSVEVNEIVKHVYDFYEEEINSSYNIRKIIVARFNVYNINLIHRSKLFIHKDDYNLILKGIQEIKEKKCITRREFLNLINNTFCGVNFAKFPRPVTDFIMKNNLEIIKNDFIGNFFNMKQYLYPEDTINKSIEYLKEYMKKKISLINMDIDEYISLEQKEFKKNFKPLLKEDCVILRESANYAHSFMRICRVFKDTNIKVIWIKDELETYVSKKEFNEFIEFKNTYIIAPDYFKKLNIKFSSIFARNNDIEVIQYKQLSYMKKEDINRYINISNYYKEIREANSLYDKVKIKIKYNPNKNEDNYPKFKEYFMRFVKHVNKRANTLQYGHSLYAIYDTLLNNIQSDLYPKNEDENNRLFSKTIKIVYKSQDQRQRLIAFVNYLRDYQKFGLNKLMDTTEKNLKEPYTAKQFITLLSEVLRIIQVQDNLVKLYRNWNLSSAVSYVFMHYSLAWRRMDLIEQLPKPNLRLISNEVTDGETFIKWLEDGNKITYKIAKEICKSIEMETKRLRKEAQKNHIKLSCIISDALTQEVALLLCINEANRQIHLNNSKKVVRYSNRCFNEVYVRPKNIQILLKETFNIDVEEILEGSFENVRMNKGFLGLVKEKAEELNLFAYCYAQVLRGHSFKTGSLAETTKIYLDKNVDKASILAFSTGTMGSVAYVILQLVDGNLKSKSIDAQLKGIQDLNMTPYTIENNLQVISNKISAMKSEIQRFFQQDGYREGFLQELLYGQHYYGIEEKTKCLIKITKKEECGISRIRSTSFNNEEVINKWCPLKRRSCIGCPYMIGLRYFIYEFEKRFNQVLDDAEKAESQLDKEIIVQSINDVYIPLLNDLNLILSIEEVSKVIDIKRYEKLVEIF